MPQETIIPFSWESWDLLDEDNHTFSQVTFNSNWGAFKKGETCEQICIQWSKGILESYTNDGKLVKTQKFIAHPLGYKL